MCDCLVHTQRLLALLNTRLITSFCLTEDLSVPSDLLEAVIVATEKIESRGKKARTVVASFCPFCGERYPHKLRP